MTTTILRGFKVPFPVLDAFLKAHDIHESEGLCAGFAPFYDQYPDTVTTLLRNKVGGGDKKTQVFVPYRKSYDFASCGYIAYDWIMVFAQRNIKPGELADTPPVGFEELRREILSYCKGNEPLIDDPRYQNGLYVVITDERPFFPRELVERNMVCSIKSYTTYGSLIMIPSRYRLRLATSAKRRSTVAGYSDRLIAEPFTGPKRALESFQKTCDRRSMYEI
ncbi:hypothetical protein VMCG_07335 [Cytospora schulzeri]|uniref:Uncharacterized protein n=1 Tax=Cytospora schulzeri TaxID=448051 RepID=A0A423WAL9_9PEZI|nr:hypothetical protein VMCG_07335 [Valsa malicola]